MQIAYALKNNVTYIGGVENETKQKDSTVCYSNDHDFCRHYCRTKHCGKLHL